MTTISLTVKQVDEVIKRELLIRMVDYAYSYATPDVEEVLTFYSVWKFYANSDDRRVLREEYPEIQEIIDTGW
tara:strand:- start:528 stop:746 length:219 start_codon:yes stop_codon:yes gene_type:complete